MAYFSVSKEIIWQKQDQYWRNTLRDSMSLYSLWNYWFDLDSCTFKIDITNISWASDYGFGPKWDEYYLFKRMPSALTSFHLFPFHRWPLIAYLCDPRPYYILDIAFYASLSPRTPETLASPYLPRPASLQPILHASLPHFLTPNYCAGHLWATAPSRHYLSERVRIQTLPAWLHPYFKYESVLKYRCWLKSSR